MRPATDAVAAWIGGFVAAEGCFTGSVRSTTKGFAFRVALGATDGATCEAIRDLLGIGTVARYARRKPHYDDEVSYSVSRLADLLDVVVPFMDEHLPASHKREQYLVWREELVDYWENNARRRRPCRVSGCDNPTRAHHLCRRHLWAIRRQ